MAFKKIPLTIDTMIRNPVPVEGINQEDNVELNIVVTENKTPKDLSSQTIKVYVRRIDGTLVEQTNQITPTNARKGEVTVKLKNSAFNKEGYALFQLDVSNSDGRITSSYATFKIGKGLVSGEVIANTNEVNALKQIEEYVKKANQELETFKQTVTEINENEATRQENEMIRIQNEEERKRKIPVLESKIGILERSSNSLYPFKSETEYSKIKEGILEFESYNSIINNLYLERVYRKCDIGGDGSKIVTTINVKKEDEVIAQLNELNYEEKTIVERIELKNLKGDGARYFITIDWSKYRINDFSLKNLTAIQTMFHENTYKKNDIIKGFVEEQTKEYVEISMPSVCYGVVGQEFNIYFDNIIMCNNIKNYQIDVWCEKGRHLDECFRIVPDREEEIGIRILVYKDFDKNKKIAEKLILLKVKTDKTITKNGILMGDSITDFNIYPTELKRIMPSVNFIGTRGTGETCKHEGRGGWTSNDYVTLPNKGGVINAFYNPNTRMFDFQYYCETNNFNNTQVDFFILELGINDVAQGYEINKIIENYNKIITSVTSYRPNCKIIIDLTIPPVGGQDGFGYKNGANKTRWEQKVLVFNLVKELIKQYDYKTNRNIYINSINLNLDTVNNFPTEEVKVNSRNSKLIRRFNDNVHPAESGFNQIADSTFYCLNYILS